MSTRKKTPDQIMKANLNRSLDRLKTKVAEKEEIWLEVLAQLLPLSINMTEKALTEEDIKRSVLLADVVLDEYEKRWG
jgi:hypothetical protein